MSPWVGQVCTDCNCQLLNLQCVTAYRVFLELFLLICICPAGKESGDRHPKVGSGVILYDSCTVLGNIPIGDGAVVMPKSIVTKPVPALSCVSGVPAKLQPHQKVIIRAEASDREAKTDWVGCAKRHLRKVYQKEWETQKALEHSGQP